jgi:hypothetical protein
MRRIAAVARSSRRSLGLAGTFLAATALLIGGTQALAPAHAAAAINQGEECDPNYPTADCETTNGGGGGSSSGSPDGGGTSEDQIIGEAIYVEGTPPPSPCGIGCLPSQVGGSRAGFLDRGGRDPRGPRPRGRLTRVGEVAKGGWTKERCKELMSDGTLAPARRAQSEAEERVQNLLTWASELQGQDYATQRAEDWLRRELERIGDLDRAVDLRMRIASIGRGRRSLRLQLDRVQAQVAPARAEAQRARDKAEVEVKALRQMCKQRYGLS